MNNARIVPKLGNETDSELYIGLSLSGKQCYDLRLIDKLKGESCIGFIL